MRSSRADVKSASEDGWSEAECREAAESGPRWKVKLSKEEVDPSQGLREKEETIWPCDSPLPVCARVSCNARDRKAQAVDTELNRAGFTHPKQDKFPQREAAD